MESYERHERRNGLIHTASVSPHLIQNARALQHLKEGFNRRVLMLDASVRMIKERIDQAKGRPISVLLVPELAIHVNSFWQNICGALDNLAWALKFELKLLPLASEESASRRSVA